MKVQQGFTLIELIVALSIGLMLSLAATQLFVANQVSFNFQRSTGDVQASGRYAIDQIANELRMAGLVNLGDTPVHGVATAMADVVGLTDATVISLTNSQASGIGRSDQLTLQYAAPADMIDCQGNTVTQGTYVIERYYVRTDTDVDASTKGLACVSATGTTVATGALAGAGVILVSGVDSFKVRLGLDDAANGVPQISRWVTASTYAALATKPAIIAVKIGLYMHSLETVGSNPPSGADVWVLDNQIASASIPQDKRLRRLFVTSVALRNVDPTGI